MAPADPGGRDTVLLRALADRVDPRDPGAFNNLGVLYHSRGMHAEAVEAFLRALAIDPRMRTAARNLEIAAAVPGSCDARLAALDARIDADPDDREALRERARLARLMGHTTDAVRRLDALIAEDPDDGAALFERGLLEQQAGDLRRAQRWFERAVNSGTHDNARLQLAEVHYQRGQNDQALELLGMVLERDPDLAEAHQLRSFVLGDIGRLEEATLAARRAAQLDPRLQALQGDLSLDREAAPRPVSTAPVGGVLGVDPDGGLAHYGLGLAFRQRGYFREARTEFERALAHGEDERLVQHALAELDLLDGESATARRRYEQLLRTQETARTWNEHGVALHQAGDVAAAAASYRRALRIDPRYALAYNNLGVALADCGDPHAAREALLRAAELDPALLIARLNLSRWYAAQGELASAIPLLRELVEFHPREPEAWHTLGRVLHQARRPEEAREALARAIEGRPSHAEARYALSQVLQLLGDDVGAVREASQAMALSPHHGELRLDAGIALQRECPEVVGPLTLLSVRGGTPLRGVALEAQAVEQMLPEQAGTDTGNADLPEAVAERADADCRAGDGFGVRQLHGEAVERYQRARLMLEAAGVPDRANDTGAARRALWRRAAVGEARSRCLLHEARTMCELLGRLVADTPHDSEVLVLLAAAQADDGDRTAAHRTLLCMAQQHTGSAALLHFAGDVAVSLDERALALGLYRRALALDPSRPSPRVAIARLLRERGDLLAARLELVAALAAVPRWREAVLELARLHYTAGRLSEARAVLVAHLAAVSTDLEALLGLLEVLLAEERYEDARVAIARLLRHDPDHAAALWYDGVLLAVQSRLREAMLRWVRVASLPDAEPWSGRAREAMARAPRVVMPRRGTPRARRAVAIGRHGP
jgi:cellulose synthase operon protein C